METKVKVGKKPLSDKKIDVIFRKLEPYLRIGLSLHAACNRGEVPKSTVYDLYKENKEFAEIVDAAQQCFTATVNDAIMLELKHMLDDQDKMGYLTIDERKFLQWICLNNKAMKAFYGRSD